MDLLNVLRDTALDPGYAAARDRPAGRRTRILTLVATLLIGVGFAVSANLSTNAAPQNARERASLIASIQQVQAEQDARRTQVAQLESDIQALSDRRALDPAVRARLDAVEPLAGGHAVAGPGVVITVDDADKATDPSQLVTDRDLRQLVNGLWTAGAEAVSINGHRLSSRTSIRSAGSAITVDYVSLVRPYTVRAIGDPKALAGNFANTSGAAWWNYLRGNYGLRYEIANATDLTLPADPGLGLTRATAPTKG